MPAVQGPGSRAAASQLHTPPAAMVVKSDRRLHGLCRQGTPRVKTIQPGNMGIRGDVAGVHHEFHGEGEQGLPYTRGMRMIMIG